MPCSKEGDLDQAQKCYTQAINTLESTKKAERDSNLLAICYSNRATVLLSKDDNEGALNDCVKSLASDGSYTKAFYRKAKAESGLGKYEEALGTVRLALKQLGAGTTKAKAMGKEREVKELRKLQSDIMGKIKAKADATVAALAKGASGGKGGADINKQVQKVEMFTRDFKMAQQKMMMQAREMKMNDVSLTVLSNVKAEDEENTTAFRGVGKMFVRETVGDLKR